jgi:hypothetical protein
MGTGASGLRLRVAISKPHRHTQLIEQSEEGGQPAIPRKEPEDDPSTRPHDLCRNHHEGTTERRE